MLIHIHSDAGRIHQFSPRGSVHRAPPCLLMGTGPGLLSASVPDCDSCIPSTEHHLGGAEKPRRDRPGARLFSSPVGWEQGSRSLLPHHASDPGLPFLPTSVPCFQPGLLFTVSAEGGVAWAAPGEALDPVHTRGRGPCHHHTLAGKSSPSGWLLWTTTGPWDKAEDLCRPGITCDNQRHALPVTG